MRQLLALLSLVLLLAACSNKPVLPPRPASVLEEDKMVEILVEVHMIEATLQRRLIRGSNPNYFGAQQYQLLFERHGISQVQFEESYAYYYQETKNMTEVYEKVLQELSRRESEIGNAQPAAGDTNSTGAE